MNKAAGFSLVELMITIVIITIVTSVALPSYRQHVQKSHRTDATAALLRLAAEQEKWYNQNNTYTTDLADIDVQTTAKEYYSLAMVSADANGFEATATAKTDGPQKNDDECKTFSITSTGIRTAENSSSSASVHCWQ